MGFDRIPDHVDAAFALPAAGHHGKEKVYFFKGAATHYRMQTNTLEHVISCENF